MRFSALTAAAQAASFASGLLFADLANAQEPVPSTVAQSLLSEEDAVRMALDRSEELTALNLLVKEQEKRAEFAGYSIKNPELRLRDISTKYAYWDEEKQLQVGLRWRPPQLGELGVREQRELVELWEKRVKAEGFRLKFIADVRKTHAQVAMLQEYVELTARQVSVQEKSLAAIERFVALGQRQLIDQIKAHKRLIRARSEASGLRQRYNDAREKLKALVGNTVIAVRALAIPAETPIEFEKLHARAIGGRAEMRLTEQKVRLVDLEYGAERYKLIPWFSFLELAYHAETDRRNWGEMRVGLELPLFNWNLGEIRATAIAKDGVESMDRAATDSVDREIRDALLRYQQAAAEWRSLKTDADIFLPKSEHLLEEAQKLQTLPADEVFDLELAIIETRQMLLEAHLHLSEAAIDLCRIVGVERPQDLWP
jgi:hypothetical protein